MPDIPPGKHTLKLNKKNTQTIEHFFCIIKRDYPFYKYKKWILKQRHLLGFFRWFFLLWGRGFPCLFTFFIQINSQGSILHNQ